jgi:hypothetical protein
MLLDTRNRPDIYWLGVGISIVFEILGHFRGDGTTMYGRDVNITPDAI